MVSMVIILVREQKNCPSRQERGDTTSCGIVGYLTMENNYQHGMSRHASIFRYYEEE
jgi:hypothetical protein